MIANFCAMMYLNQNLLLLVEVRKKHKTFMLDYKK